MEPLGLIEAVGRWAAAHVDPLVRRLPARRWQRRDREVGGSSRPIRLVSPVMGDPVGARWGSLVGRVEGLMYAVVRTGGKQYRVEQGQRLAVERVGEPGAEVALEPVLVVDGDEVLATPADLAGASVRALVVDEHRGPKINGFTYKSKSNQRRRWGHRQTLATIEITAIERG